MSKKISDFYNNNPFNFDIKIVEDIKNSKKSSIPINIKKLIHKYKIRSIIDIGCGSGYFVNLIKYHYSEMEVFGLDFSKVQLNNAKKISRGLNQKINYINEDFLLTKLNKKIKRNNFKSDLLTNKINSKIKIDTYCKDSRGNISENFVKKYKNVLLNTR